MENTYEGGEKANGSADFENIFARVSESKGDCNGFPDLAIAADCKFICFLGLDQFSTLRVIKIFLPGFRFQGKMLTLDLVNKS